MFTRRLSSRFTNACIGGALGYRGSAFWLTLFVAQGWCLLPESALLLFLSLPARRTGLLHRGRAGVPAGQRFLDCDDGVVSRRRIKSCLEATVPPPKLNNCLRAEQMQNSDNQTMETPPKSSAPTFLTAPEFDLLGYHHNQGCNICRPGLLGRPTQRFEAPPHKNGLQFC